MKKMITLLLSFLLLCGCGSSDGWEENNDQIPYQASTLEADVDASDLEILKYLDVDSFVSTIQNQDTYACYKNNDGTDNVGQIIFAFSPNDSIAYAYRTSYLLDEDESETDAYICYLPDSGQIALISLSEQNKNRNIGIYNFSYVYDYYLAWIFKPGDLLSNSTISAFYFQIGMSEYPYIYSEYETMSEYEIKNTHFSDSLLSSANLSCVSEQILYSTDYYRTAKVHSAGSLTSTYNEYFNKNYEVLKEFLSEVYSLNNLYTIKLDSKYYSFSSNDSKFELQGLKYYVNDGWEYFPHEFEIDDGNHINALIFTLPDGSSTFWATNFKRVSNEFKKLTGNDFADYIHNIYKEDDRYIDTGDYFTIGNKEVIDIVLVGTNGLYVHLLNIKEGEKFVVIEIDSLESNIGDTYNEFILNISFE